MNKEKLNLHRRKFTQKLIAAGSGLLASGFTSCAQATEEPVKTKRAFRFAHFGDTHVGGGSTMPLCASPEGLPKAIKHVQAIKDTPEFILHTGDIITDAFWATEEISKSQWEIYRGIMQEHCNLPVHYTLGNHDVNFDWGYGGEGALFPGKALAMEQLGMISPYYSFDHGGWHFIVLDDTQPGGWVGFQIYLDDAQFAWLEKDLQETDPITPILIASHAPILSAACFFEPLGKKHPDGLVIDNSCVHQDIVKIHDLFRKHRNVKLCLSGHYHQIDHIQYLGVHHICGGAVCANYWKAPLPYRPEFEAGYGVVDLFSDGSFEYRFNDYGLVGYMDNPDRKHYPWGKI